MICQKIQIAKTTAKHTHTHTQHIQYETFNKKSMLKILVSLIRFGSKNRLVCVTVAELETKTKDMKNIYSFIVGGHTVHN